MAFLDFKCKKKLKIWDGIKGSFFHSAHITFGHITLEKGTILPEHRHFHEQWTHVVEGSMEFTIGGETSVLGPGMAALIPPDVPHSAKAITECKVIDCFLPIREDFVELESKPN